MMKISTFTAALFFLHIFLDNRAGYLFRGYFYQADLFFLLATFFLPCIEKGEWVVWTPLGRKP